MKNNTFKAEVPAAVPNAANKPSARRRENDR